jgi:hypothetical protein
MKPGRFIAGWPLIAALVCAAAPARGEEIILKDGQKIVGTIVGYEKDMFRVETDYGIALVRKDKVASIQVSKPDAAKPGPEAIGPGETRPTPRVGKADASQSNLEPRRPPAAKTEKAASATPPESPPAADSGGAGAIANRISPITNREPAPAVPAPEKAPAPPPQPPPPAPKPPPPPPPPVSYPVDVPMPAHIQERVEGNSYFNDTFQFSMFKPPDWKTYEGVPKETGSGIMAMGTEDERTLLIVDRQVWSGAPKLSSDQVEAKLRQTYQEYRRISEDSGSCDGQPAIRRTFSGVLDGAEWHGVAVHVIQGNTVFGIIGLTSAETFEFQQAIFNKIIRSFHFLTSAPPASASGPANPAP